MFSFRFSYCFSKRLLVLLRFAYMFCNACVFVFTSKIGSAGKFFLNNVGRTVRNSVFSLLVMAGTKGKGFLNGDLSS